MQEITIPHRRARIDEAVVEVFRPLMAWRGDQAYMGAEARLMKLAIAEKTGDMPLYDGIRRNYGGHLYETEANIAKPARGTQNGTPDVDPQWNQLPAYPRYLREGVYEEDNPLFVFQTVRKQYRPWTSLREQGAIPALMLVPGDMGSKPDSEVADFIDERYPVSLLAVLEEKEDYPLIDQHSDMQYAVERIFNPNTSLGVEGVLTDQTKIESWRNSEESLYPVLMVKFRVLVVHRYHTTTAV